MKTLINLFCQRADMLVNGIRHSVEVKQVHNPFSVGLIQSDLLATEHS